MSLVKNARRSALNTSLAWAARRVKAMPRVKNYLKAAIVPHLIGGSTQEIAYLRWVARNYPDAIELDEQRRRAAELRRRPLISILLPTYDSEPEHLRECVDSVRAQTYEDWQLCIVDDASSGEWMPALLDEIAALDERIVVRRRETNGHIAAASNDALSIAEGEFVGMLDHDDVLWPNALFEVARALDNEPEADFLYTDEEKIGEHRHDHQLPFFKPGWNPEFLESVNYITHFAVLRRGLVESIGGFRSECDGAQDWDLFLRASEQTERIVHVPKVVYSWRMSATSTALTSDSKPYVVEAQRRALSDHFERTGAGPVLVEPGVIADYWHCRHPVRDSPMVSIVIPTKDQPKLVRRCVESIRALTSYSNYEIVLVDTGSTDHRVRSYYQSLQAAGNVEIVDFPERPFSYARTCNVGAGHARGEFLVMLNNDTEILTPDWLELLLGDAQRPEIGAVGCKLLYPDGLHIQHAGILVGICDVAANALSRVPEGGVSAMQHLYANTRHAISAVTAACLMVERSKFESVGGFTEDFAVTFNDVDLCLKLLDAGLRNLYTPHVRVLHYESITLGTPDEAHRDTTEYDAACAMLQERWPGYVERDPFLNPNLDRETALLELPVPVPAADQLS